MEYMYIYNQSVLVQMNDRVNINKREWIYREIRTSLIKYKVRITQTQADKINAKCTDNRKEIRWNTWKRSDQLGWLEIKWT